MDFEDDDEEFLTVGEELESEINGDKSDINISEPKNEHIQCLQNNFGHSSFRPFQWQVIRSIIEDKRDNCAIMTTGYGKSLCFQFPPVYSNGISLNVSPLISLMQDQVDSLNLVNIPACMLGSAQLNKSIENNVIRGDYRIVYVSPEYITGSGSHLINKLKDKLALIAVDEAHCISKWGADFRPKYMALKNIRADASNVPILAITATASDRVQQDICTNLQLKKPQIICTGFDRPNLEIIVRRKTRDPWDDIGLIFKSKLLMNASCIIYCITRKQTDQICDLLKRNDFKCGSYHAGKTLKERKDVYDKFVHDEINVVIATIAFGMGIDKSDMRCVIHYGSPPDIDSYYQEIGRAGRDGMPSKCVLFYSERDFSLQRQLRLNSNLSGAVLKNAEQRANLMIDFIFTTDCRRLKILQYFEGPSAQCPVLDVCCDNCRIAKVSSQTKQNQNTEVDFSKDAKIMLNVIKLFNGKSGISKPISILRNSKTKSIQQFHNHELMGSGKLKSEEYWKIFADLLEHEGLLERKNVYGASFNYIAVELSEQGRQWLANKNNVLKLVPPSRMLQLMEQGSSTSKATIPSSIKPLYNTTTNSGAHSSLPINKPSSEQELKRNLMLLRATIASREGIMPYKIALEPAIDHLVRMQPLNMQELREAKVEGFSEAIIKNFGPEFLQCIQRSKGFLSQDIVAKEQVEQQTELYTNVQDATDNCASSLLSLINPVQVTAKDVNSTFGFEDDDDLFLTIDCESNQQRNDSPEKYQKITKRLATSTSSRRIKYDANSDEDDEAPKTNQGNKSNSRELPSENSRKIMGIKKKKIF